MTGYADDYCHLLMNEDRLQSIADRLADMEPCEKYTREDRRRALGSSSC